MQFVDWLQIILCVAFQGFLIWRFDSRICALEHLAGALVTVVENHKNHKEKGDSI